MTTQYKYCPSCKKDVPTYDFGSLKSSKDGLSAYCKPCIREKSRARYQDPQYRRIAIERQREHYRKNRERKTQQARYYRQNLRAEALVAYGGEYAACACCEEWRWQFLEIDHMNNDGAQHRKELKDSSTAVLRWLRRQGYPPGYQVLCRNCNHARYVHGTCPHQIPLE